MEEAGWARCYSASGGCRPGTALLVEEDWATHSPIWGVGGALLVKAAGGSTKAHQAAMSGLCSGGFGYQHWGQEHLSVA